MWWTTGCGYVELNITKKQAETIPLQGQADFYVKELIKDKKINRQLSKLNCIDVVKTLKDYGAWNDVELLHNTSNLHRLLWVACCDINEGTF